MVVVSQRVTGKFNTKSHPQGDRVRSRRVLMGTATALQTDILQNILYTVGEQVDIIQVVRAREKETEPKRTHAYSRGTLLGPATAFVYEGSSLMGDGGEAESCQRQRISVPKTSIYRRRYVLTNGES